MTYEYINLFKASNLLLLEQYTSQYTNDYQSCDFHFIPFTFFITEVQLCLGHEVGCVSAFRAGQVRKHSVIGRRDKHCFVDLIGAPEPPTGANGMGDIPATNTVTHLL